MLSKKIVSTILAVCVAGGVGTAGALTLANTPKTSATTNSEVLSSVVSSQIISSQVPSSSKEVKTVDDGTSAIKKATDDGVSKINSVTSQAIDKVQQAASSKEPITDPKYLPKFDVVNPNTGELVLPTDSAYDTIKAQLGGDAGTVMYTKSTACMNALNKYRAEHPPVKNSSSSR